MAILIANLPRLGKRRMLCPYLKICADRCACVVALKNAPSEARRSPPARPVKIEIDNPHWR